MTARRKKGLASIAIALVALGTGGCGGSDDDGTSEDRAQAKGQKPSRYAGPVPKSKAKHFDSLDKASQAIGQWLRTPPAPLPDLPAGVEPMPQTVRLMVQVPNPDKPRDRERSAVLSLRMPNESVLTIQYGIASFDGCGPSDPRRSTVGRHPALVSTAKLAGGGAAAAHSHVVWPAKKQNPVGRFGLSGEFSPRRALALANSMAVATPGRTAVRHPGC